MVSTEHKLDVLFLHLFSIKIPKHRYMYDILGRVWNDNFAVILMCVLICFSSSNHR